MFGQHKLKEYLDNINKTKNFLQHKQNKCLDKTNKTNDLTTQTKQMT